MLINFLSSIAFYVIIIKTNTSLTLQMQQVRNLT